MEDGEGCLTNSRIERPGGRDSRRSLGIFKSCNQRKRCRGDLDLQIKGASVLVSRGLGEQSRLRISSTTSTHDEGAIPWGRQRTSSLIRGHGRFPGLHHLTPYFTCTLPLAGGYLRIPPNSTEPAEASSGEIPGYCFESSEEKAIPSHDRHQNAKAPALRS